LFKKKRKKRTSKQITQTKKKDQFLPNNFLYFLDFKNISTHRNSTKKMNTYQFTVKLIVLTILLIALKRTEAHFYGMVEKPSKFDSKQDFVDYMLKLNQHNAITNKLGTTRYGKRSFRNEDSSDESYMGDASEEQEVEANDAPKKAMIIKKIIQLLKMLE